VLGYPRGHLAPTQDQWNRLIHPDGLADNHAAYLRHAEGLSEQYEHIYRTRDAQGRWRWLHERGRIDVQSAPGKGSRFAVELPRA
jgi:hypothetical protein